MLYRIFNDRESCSGYNVKWKRNQYDSNFMPSICICLDKGLEIKYFQIPVSLGVEMIDDFFFLFCASSYFINSLQ